MVEDKKEKKISSEFGLYIRSRPTWPCKILYTFNVLEIWQKWNKPTLSRVAAVPSPAEMPPGLPDQSPPPISFNKSTVQTAVERVLWMQLEGDEMTGRGWPWYQSLSVPIAIRPFDDDSPYFLGIFCCNFRWRRFPDTVSSYGIWMTSRKKHCMWVSESIPVFKSWPVVPFRWFQAHLPREISVSLWDQASDSSFYDWNGSDLFKCILLVHLSALQGLKYYCGESVTFDGTIKPESPACSYIKNLDIRPFIG